MTSFFIASGMNKVLFIIQINPPVSSFPWSFSFVTSGMENVPTIRHPEQPCNLTCLALSSLWSLPWSKDMHCTIHCSEVFQSTVSCPFSLHGVWCGYGVNGLSIVQSMSPVYRPLPFSYHSSSKIFYPFFSLLPFPFGLSVSAWEYLIFHHPSSSAFHHFLIFFSFLPFVWLGVSALGVSAWEWLAFHHPSSKAFHYLFFPLWLCFCMRMTHFPPSIIHMISQGISFLNEWEFQHENDSLSAIHDPQQFTSLQTPAKQLLFTIHMNSPICFCVIACFSTARTRTSRSPIVTWTLPAPAAPSPASPLGHPSLPWQHTTFCLSCSNCMWCIQLTYPATMAARAMLTRPRWKTTSVI